MEFSFEWRDEKFNLELSKVPWWREGIGLMFSSRKKAKILLFDLKRPVKMSVHSYFVKFPFIAIWLDEHKKVVEIKQIKPSRGFIRPSKRFRYLIEVPMTQNYDTIVKSLLTLRNSRASH